jgi:hypothetical protein
MHERTSNHNFRHDHLHQGDKAYTGGTTINAGTLQLGNDGTTGSIVGDVANHAIFAINRSDTFTFGVISGTGRPGAVLIAGFKSPSSALSAVFRAQAGTNIPKAGVIGPTFAGTTAAIDHRVLAVQYRKRNPAVVEMLLFTKKLFDNPPLNSVQKQPM